MASDFSGHLIGPPGSGSITAMAQSPSNPDIIYTAFEDVAVLRSSDGGITFDTADVAPFSSPTVTCLAVDPSDSDVVLAGVLEPFSHMNQHQVSLWRSKDGGKNWVRTTTPTYEITGVNLIVFNPDNPDVVLAGTNFSVSYSPRTAPLYRSADGGISWTAAPDNAFMPYLDDPGVLLDVERTGITALLFDRENPGRVLAGFTGDTADYNYGLFESWDDGITWNAIRADPFAQAGGNPVFSLLQMPDSESTILAGTSVKSGNNRTQPLWKSDDTGYTWTPATPEFNSRSTTVTGFHRLAYHPDYPSTIWAAQSPPLSKYPPYWESWPKDAALLRSDDFGDSWQILPPLLTGDVFPADTIQGLIAQGGSRPQLLVGYTGLGLWSLDAGDTELSPQNGGLPFGTVADIAVTGNRMIAARGTDAGAPSPVASRFWRNGKLAWRAATGLPEGGVATELLVNPLDNMKMLAVVDNDLYFSNDRGDSWNFKRSGIKNISQARPGSNEIFLTDSDSKFLISHDFGETFINAGAGLGFATAHDFSVSNSGMNVVVAAGPGNGQTSLGSGVFVSDDGGASFHKSNRGIPSYNNLVNLRWADNGDDVYATEGDALFYSHNGGSNWVPKMISLQASPTTATLISPDEILDIQIGSAKSTQCLWLLTNRAFLYRSLDNGDSWQAIAPVSIFPIMEKYEDYNNTVVNLQAMAVSAANPDNLWVIGPRAMAHSTNGGDDWTTWSRNGLRLSNITELAVDEQNTDRMFAADGNSIFRSMDGGLSWTDVSIGGGIGQLVLPVNFPQRIVVGTDWGALWISEDNGDSWTESNTFHSNRPLQIAVSPTDSTMYVLSNDGECFISTNSGLSWEPWFDAPYRGFNLTAGQLAVSPTTSTELLFSEPNGTIYRTTDGMRNWEEASPDLNNSRVTAVAANPYDANVMFAGTRGSGIYKSMDGGQSWTQCLRMIFDFAVNDIEINPDNTNECFAATDWGLFYTEDAGANWRLVTDELEDAEVRQVELSRTAQGLTVYAVPTHGGIWTNGAGNVTATGSDWQLFE